MPRISIEEKWWTDPRRQKLGQLLGNPFFSETCAIMVWRLAQEYWEKGELIPGHIYSMCFGAMELLKCNLAQLHESKEPRSSIIRTPIEHISNVFENDSNTIRTHMNIIEHSYVYVRGSVEYLSWGREIRQKRVEAGKKSAEKRALLYGSSQPCSNKPRTLSEQNPTNPNSPAPVPVPVPVPAPVPKKKKNNNVGIRLDYPQEFNELWVTYGPRGDKKAAFQEYQNLNLAEHEFEELKKAIHSYCKANPEQKFRKHFFRFLKMDWRELLKAHHSQESNGIDWEGFNWGDEDEQGSLSDTN